ncbi:MAG TPA: L,D-transpeptidase family protein [Armatimonadota bacterium]|jgi:hypothetical protein
MRTWHVALALLAVVLLAAPAHAVTDDASALTSEAPLGTEAVREVELKPSLTLLNPAPGAEWLEGSPATIRWVSTGPIKTVRLFFYGDLSRLSGNARGSFSNVIADAAPNTGSYRWTVPWIDASGFVIRLAGYDAKGQRLAETERGIDFRPKEAAGLEGTYIVVSKHRQRLWYYQDSRLRWISLVSTAQAGYETPQMRPGSYGSRGAMGKVFGKDPDAFSKMYKVHMLWWMAITSSGSHGIHATSPNFYDYLGSPASHGCIRQTREDAHNLYDMVKVGTPVYVF